MGKRKYRKVLELDIPINELGILEIEKKTKISDKEGALRRYMREYASYLYWKFPTARVYSLEIFELPFCEDALGIPHINEFLYEFAFRDDEGYGTITLYVTMNEERTEILLVRPTTHLLFEDAFTCANELPGYEDKYFIMAIGTGADA